MTGAHMARNPRYYGPGGWKARNASIEACRARAAAGEPCAICGQPIDVTRRWILKDGRRVLDPLSCECDEIVPISMGGSPTGDNTRPVHRICNERRGADMGRFKTSEGVKRVSVHETAHNVAGGRW